MKKRAAAAAVEEALAREEEAKKTKMKPSLMVTGRTKGNNGIASSSSSFAGKKTFASSSFATIGNKQKKTYEPLLCEEDERNRAKERLGALKRQEMHAMENASLTNALREDVPRKKKRVQEEEEEEEEQKEEEIHVFFFFLYARHSRDFFFCIGSPHIPFVELPKDSHRSIR